MPPTTQVSTDMRYDYATHSAPLFTKEGSAKFIRRRDAVLALAARTGAVRMQEAMGVMGAGDSWEMLATIDRMVELGDLEELRYPDARHVAGQHRVFVRKEH